MAEPVLWLNNPGPVSGSTVFGYFDTSSQFQSDAPRAARWAALRLGYSSVDVEMDSASFYACYEEAILEYSAQVQQFTIRENLLTLIGTSNDPTSTSYVNYSSTALIPNLQTMIQISENYGAEAGVGGQVTWHKSSIFITQSKQNYDLNMLIASASASGEAIEIKRVYHFEPVAYGYGLSGVYNAPGVLGTAGQAGTYGLLGEFGWEGLAAGGIATGLSYTLMPVYEDLLRMQAVEFNFQMRRSGYGFEIRNNQLRIFPAPTSDMRLWIEWAYTKDKRYGSPDSGSSSQTSGSQTTNIGDAPFSIMSYDKINDPGMRWIMKYYLACCKETLGEIRSKYQTIPIPGSEVTLNGDQLKQEAQQEKENLIMQLREDLEQTSTQAQMQKAAENADNLMNILNKVPQGIFVG